MLLIDRDRNKLDRLEERLWKQNSNVRRLKTMWLDPSQFSSAKEAEQHIEQHFRYLMDISLFVNASSMWRNEWEEAQEHEEALLFQTKAALDERVVFSSFLM